MLGSELFNRTTPIIHRAIGDDCQSVHILNGLRLCARRWIVLVFSDHATCIGLTRHPAQGVVLGHSRIVLRVVDAVLIDRHIGQVSRDLAGLQRVIMPLVGIGGFHRIAIASITAIGDLL